MSVLTAVYLLIGIWAAVGGLCAIVGMMELVDHLEARRCRSEHGHRCVEREGGAAAGTSMVYAIHMPTAGRSQ